MEIGPAFVESIKTDADFLNIQKRMDENWWYALDSKCILDNEKDRLTEYSFKQINELYENKVKKLRPKNIKKCAEVLEVRNELKFQINALNITFNNLLVEQENYQKDQLLIKEAQLKMRELENKINKLSVDLEKLSPEEQERRMTMLCEELNFRLDKLRNQTEEKRIKKLVSSNYCNHCDYCENNFQDECNCWFREF